ncbi:hypothetical protein PIIN_07019 [Serendipita indica DSM 11827]|uniref:Uncharacterized protein n=1 Tax=Serendipita indica (strain DSM 11827) TaxID=1109443 RepID=G4TP36_SERID|nr:hypothetical protein PIIN_07019 [Serendipita indica DSM 11827]
MLPRIKVNTATMSRPTPLHQEFQIFISYSYCWQTTELNFSSRLVSESRISSLAPFYHGKVAKKVCCRYLQNASTLYTPVIHGRIKYTLSRPVILLFTRIAPCR